MRLDVWPFVSMIIDGTSQINTVSAPLSAGEGVGQLSVPNFEKGRLQKSARGD